MIQSAVDTLVCDSTQVSLWQSDPAYAYNKELTAPDINILDWLRKKFADLISELFNSPFLNEYSDLILLCIGVVFIIFIGWLIYRKRPELFMRSKKKKLGYMVEEDTIYGVDFVGGIKNALARSDYKDAVRLLYLQTLKMLSDEARIDWQLYKTPSQYMKEETTPSFRQFTTHFLRVRYGNFEASQELFDTMKALQDDIEKGGNK